MIITRGSGRIVAPTLGDGGDPVAQALAPSDYQPPTAEQIEAEQTEAEQTDVEQGIGIIPELSTVREGGANANANANADAETNAEAGGQLSQETYAGWVLLVDRIRSGESDGMAELYQLFSRGIRFYLCRQLGPQELDDKIHDTFVVVVQAIRRGELREPERLMGFVRTIVRRQVAAHIDKVVHSRREQVDLDSTIRVSDPRQNPEQTAIFRERMALIRKVLGELCQRDREILTRFYLREQSQDEICTEMALTETQFRLLKSRAKARFGELGKKKLAQKSLHAVFLRTSAGSLH
jgi:RNA polymerase sigma-70 factor (ECF subfamily)